jgi:hypothetical protein
MSIPGSDIERLLLAQMARLRKPSLPIAIVEANDRLTKSLQGIFWAFTMFNFIAVYFFSWLYLHGAGDLKRWISARKARKGVQ